MSTEPAEPDDDEPSSEELLVPAGYIVRDEAIKQLGSKATVERKVASQQLRSTLVPRDGRKPVRVYLAEDVETLLRQKQQRREAQPPSVRAAAAETGLVPKVPSSPNGVPAPFFTELVNVVREIAIAQQELRERIGQLQLLAPQEQQQPQVPLETKLWLSLEEARAYSGLTKKDLLDLMHDDIVTFRPVMRRRGVPLRILRASLDAFQG